jgi:hypothetical protein
LKYLGIKAEPLTGAVSPFAINFRIYVDGSLKAEFHGEWLDMLAGKTAIELYNATKHHITYGLPLPSFAARITASPEQYLIISPNTGPRGGLIHLIWNRDVDLIVEFGGFLNAEFEFVNRLRVTAYNRHSTANFIASVSAIIGEYL